MASKQKEQVETIDPDLKNDMLELIETANQNMFFSEKGGGALSDFTHLLSEKRKLSAAAAKAEAEKHVEVDKNGYLHFRNTSI